MVDKKTWLKLRKESQIDLEHIHFGINLNKTVDLTIGKLQVLLQIMNNNIPFAVQEVMSEAKMRLDKHFHVVTFHNDKGIEIKTIT